MMKLLLFIMLFLANVSAYAATPFAAVQVFDVLSYHDVRDEVDGDLELETTTISTKNLARHFAWLQAHGYHPVSINDLIDAKNGKKLLPSKPILLTFDDGYQSVYSRVYPLLKLYKYPAVSALVGSWLAVPDGQTVQYGDEKVPREHFLTAQQIKEMADSGLVEFVSHSYDLHHGVLANPQGNQTPAAVTLQYDATTKAYEPRESYRNRIKQDLLKNNILIQKLTGKAPKAMVWPYGAHNAIVVEVANELGMPITLTLNDDDGQAQTNKLEEVGRILIDANPTERVLADIEKREVPLDRQRVMHIDLDFVFDENAEQMAKNLDSLLDRVKSFEPTTVYLQAFSDANGDGVAEAAYFPNRHVAMRADLFSRVSWQLMTRANVKVYAWMPVLAFELKDKQKQQALQVVSAQPEADKNAYKRLSPFSAEARQIVQEIYSDLGAHTKFNGVLFHDDAVLSEHEDDSQFARAVYQDNFKLAGNVSDINRDSVQATKLVALKSRHLTDFTMDLAKELKRYIPQLKTARNLYAPALLNPESERWLSQNYANFLANYDYTAVMAMPFMENAEDPNAWLKSLVEKAKVANGLQKTVFELQASNWKTKRPIDTQVLKQQLQILGAAGAVHVGYYPDDFLKNQPEMEEIRPYISSRNFPYLPNAPKSLKSK